MYLYTYIKDVCVCEHYLLYMISFCVCVCVSLLQSAVNSFTTRGKVYVFWCVCVYIYFGVCELEGV
jgi:hypothetical protein